MSISPSSCQSLSLLLSITTTITCTPEHTTATLVRADRVPNATAPLAVRHQRRRSAHRAGAESALLPCIHTKVVRVSIKLFLHNVFQI